MRGQKLELDTIVLRAKGATGPVKASRRVVGSAEVRVLELVPASALQPATEYEVVQRQQGAAPSIAGRFTTGRGSAPSVSGRGRCGWQSQMARGVSAERGRAAVSAGGTGCR